MKRISTLLCFALLFTQSCIKEEQNEKVENNLSEISVTGAVEDIESTSATLYGWANIGAEYKPIIEVGFEYSEDKSMSSSSECSSSYIDSDNMYSCTLTYLKRNTKYYYRSYLQYLSSGIYEYGIIRSFTTNPTSPVFDKSESLVYGIKVSLTFNLKDDGGQSIESCRVYYSKDDLSGLDESQIMKCEYINATYENGCVNAIITSLSENTKYYSIAYAKNKFGHSFSNVVSYTTGIDHSSSQYSVDMGLSVKWATMNVGAETENEIGDYFAWGETKPVNKGVYEGYSLSEDISELARLTKYCIDPDDGYKGFVDNITTLESIDDAAHINWGGKWRMPTYEEVKELADNCYWIWTNNYQNTHRRGFIAESKINGNRIFLPFGSRYIKGAIFQDEYLKCGYYWSSSLNTLDSHCARALSIWYYPSGSSGIDTENNTRGRAQGFLIRPVLK